MAEDRAPGCIGASCRAVEVRERHLDLDLDLNLAQLYPLRDPLTGTGALVQLLRHPVQSAPAPYGAQVRVLPGSNASLSGALAKHISQSGTDVENVTPPPRGTAGVTPSAVDVGAATADDASGTTTSAEAVEEVDPVVVVAIEVVLLMPVVVVCANPVDIVDTMRIAGRRNRRAFIVAPPSSRGKSTRVVVGEHRGPASIPPVLVARVGLADLIS